MASMTISMVTDMLMGRTSLSSWMLIVTLEGAGTVDMFDCGL
jgi:hypothetical protein